VSSVRLVPDMGEDRVTAVDSWRALRRYGPGRFLRFSFIRFRYGDGFSHSRALGLQLGLAAVPLVIAAIGLSSTLRDQSLRQVLFQTMLELTPGASEDLLSRMLSPRAQDFEDDVFALVLGLGFALIALTTAMGQLERGANRIYGVQRDRPVVHKYGRAALLAGVAGLPAMAGFVVLVTADASSEALESVYGLSDDAATASTRSVGVVLLVAAITIMLRHSPRRQQPGWSLLAVGSLVAVVSWIGLTALLGAFLKLSAQIGSVYGPLTGVMALLVWAQLTSVTLFLGMAVSAELEVAAAALRRGGWHSPDTDADL